MATKTISMRVCDVCGKSVEELNNTAKINDVEYKEVCDECVAKMNELVKKLQTPRVSQYMKRKARMVEAK